MMKHGEQQFLYAHRHVVDRAWQLQAHAHSHYELVVVLEGTELITIGGETLEVRQGQAALFPANRAHEQRVAESAGRLCSIAIGFEWSEYRAGMPVVVDDTLSRLLELSSWLVAERHGTSAPSDHLRHQLLAALIAEFERLSESVGWAPREAKAEGAIAVAIRRYVHDHISEPFSLDDLAAHVSMSKFYFARAYRALTGLSPMDHARLMRLERARDMVVSTRLPLKAIAPLVGFASEFHLSRLLRNRLGLGARELRAADSDRSPRPFPALRVVPPVDEGVAPEPGK